MRRPSTAADFWARVERRGPDDCWLWTGPLQSDGYGKIGFGGRTWIAHRLAWALTSGAVGGDLCVSHRCAVPACCNPAHLWLRTRAENRMDGVRTRRANADRTRGAENAGRHTVTSLYAQAEQVTESGCRIWMGNLNGGGYGAIRNFNPKNHRGSEQAHRAVWTLANGPIPNGLWVLHKCDVRACINADHLFLGTHADNMSDMVRKGRSPRGERSGPTRHPGSESANAKLTEVMIPEIRRRHADGEGLRSIGVRFGVTRSAISRVVRGDTWKHC